MIWGSNLILRTRHLDLFHFSYVAEISREETNIKGYLLSFTQIIENTWHLKMLGQKSLARGCIMILKKALIKEKKAEIGKVK